MAILLLPAAGGGVAGLFQTIRRRTCEVKKHYLILGLAGIIIAIIPHNLPDTEATDNMNKAIYLCRADRLSEALEAAGTAIACSPNSADAWFVLGNVHVARTNYPAALRSYERALGIQSWRTDALFNAGLVLERMGRKKEALAYYHKVIAREPRHAAAWLGLAFVSRELGDEQSARQAITKAAELVGRAHPQIVEFYGGY